MKTPPWYDLPTPLAVPLLIQMRDALRQKNLFDTEEPAMPTRAASDPVPEEVKDARTVDGSWNDLGCPHMGAATRRFGRNFPLEETRPDTAVLLNPNPREVSNTLLTRQEFQPATILNLNAASWIQFMVHDWFMHKNSDARNIEVSHSRRRPVARPSDAYRRHGARPRPLRIHAPARLRQHEQPLVGRLTDLWLRPRHVRPGPQRGGWQTSHRRRSRAVH